jgi:hypothetical protein
MVRGSSRFRKQRGARGEAEGAAFDRTHEALGRLEEATHLSPVEIRVRFADALRLATRLKKLEERLGRTGIVELSPYLQSLLRMAQVPEAVGGVEFRQAAGF